MSRRPTPQSERVLTSPAPEGEVPMERRRPLSLLEEERQSCARMEEWIEKENADYERQTINETIARAQTKLLGPDGKPPSSLTSGREWEKISPEETQHAPEALLQYNQQGSFPSGVFYAWEGFAFSREGRIIIKTPTWEHYASANVRELFGGARGLYTAYAIKTQASQEEIAIAQELQKAELMKIRAEIKYLDALENKNYGYDPQRYPLFNMSREEIETLYPDQELQDAALKYVNITRQYDLFELRNKLEKAQQERRKKAWGIVDS